jgi:hypothetical protein
VGWKESGVVQGNFNDVLPFSLSRRRKSASPARHQNSVHPIAALRSPPNRCIQPLSLQIVFASTAGSLQLLSN